MATEKIKKYESEGLLRRLRLTVRQHQAAELRLQGLSYMQIAREMGIALGSASEFVRQALERTKAECTESASHIRDMELQKLDRMESVLWDLLAEGGGELVTREEGQSAQGFINKVKRTQPGIGGVIDRLLAVQKRRADMLGLDAAQKFEHTGEGGGPLSLEVIARIIEKGDNEPLTGQSQALK